MALRDPCRLEPLPNFLQKTLVRPERGNFPLVGKEYQRFSLTDGKGNSGCLAGLGGERTGTSVSRRYGHWRRRRCQGRLNAVRRVLQIEEPLLEVFDRILEAQIGFFDQAACERMCCIQSHCGNGARKG